MRKKPGVTPRGNRWYYRKRVPDHLRQIVGKEMIVLNLETSDLAVANRRQVHATSEAQSILDEAEEALKSGASTGRSKRRRMAWRKETEPAEEPLRALSDLSEDELTRMVQDYLVSGMKQDMDDFLRIKPEGPEQHHQNDYLQRLKDVLQVAREDAVGTVDDLQTGNPEHVARIAVDLLQRQRIEMEMQSIQYDRLIRRLLQAEMHRERQRTGLYASKLADGGEAVSATPFDTMTHQNLDAMSVASAFGPQGMAPGRPPVRKVLTVAELIKEYEKEPSRRKTTAKTLESYNTVYGVLKELNGMKTLTPDTVDKYMKYLSAMFGWAVKRRYMAYNPAEGLTIKRKTKKRHRRQPFVLEQLKLIFSTPLYTGCRDGERGYLTPGTNRPQVAIYWAPLISLYSGLRLNEICQLLVQDIRQQHDTWCLFVNKDGDPEKRVKTVAGERYVPLHPELVKFGLLRHRAAMADRAGETGRLFPELRRASSGYLSDRVSKRFRRLLDFSGAKTEKTTFHSFRHNFNDAMRRADIAVDRRKLLGGWEDDDDTEANYGDGFMAPMLAEDIARVSYEGLDLSHLYVGQPDDPSA